MGGHVDGYGSSVRMPQSLEELDDLLLQGDLGGRQAELAADCEALAGRATAHAPVSRSELLVAAAEQYRLAGDLAKSVSLCRAAVADAGPTRLDARAHLVAALSASGQAQEALSAVDAIWADRPWDPHLLIFVGEQLEMLDELNKANAWYTRGVVRPDPEAGVAIKVLVLFARMRVRARLGFTPDEFDVFAEDLLEEYEHQNAAEQPQPHRQGRCGCGLGNKSKRCCGTDSTYPIVTAQAARVYIDLVTA